MTKKAPAMAGVAPAAVPAGYAGIHGGIVDLLDAARQTAARSVNALMTASYWEIGRRIVEAEQQGKRRAGYGEQLIERLASDLTQQFGRGFSRQNLQQMRSFFLTRPIRQTVSGISPEYRIVQTVSVQSASPSGPPSCPSFIPLPIPSIYPPPTHRPSHVYFCKSPLPVSFASNPKRIAER